MAELSLLVKATIVLAAALLVARAARRAAASVRALVIASSFAVLLVLPLAIIAIPPRTVEIPAASMPGLLLQESGFDASLATAAFQSTNVAPLPTSGFRMPSLAIVSRIAWAAGALLFFAPIVVALWRLQRMRTSGLPWLEGRTLVAEVAAHSGVARPVDVFLHAALAAPMTCGFLRPAIGLPVDAPRWTKADLHQALVHEMEHVRRRDWPVHLMARMACALYWFHPLAWIAWRQLLLESERACDDAVLSGAEGTAYAEQLVSLARRLSKHSPVPLLSMADRSNLSTRVSAVLDTRIARGRAGLFSALLIVSGAWAILFAISPLQAVSTTTLLQSVASTPTDPAFEVASIRQNTSTTTNGGTRPLPDGFTATNVSLRTLIFAAYRIPNRQIIGGSPWVDSVRYDVAAKATGNPSPDQVDVMLRSLLRDRFNLVVHRETRDVEVYALVLARADGRLGPRLQKAAVDCSDPAARAKLAAAPFDPNARPVCGLRSGAGRFVAGGTTLSSLAQGLVSASGRTVVDRTGLAGAFDIELEWAPTPDADGVSLFTAVQEQLGLKLESAKAPLDVLVIDRVEPPTPNDAPAAPAPQASTPAPVFDVASVRRNTSGEQIMRGPLVQPGNRVVAQNIAVRFLITTAYSLDFNQIVGAPPWIDTDRFDIDARAQPDASPDDLKAMLRALLADRFRLSAHNESQERPIYTLVRTRAGSTPGLRTSGTDCAPITTPTGGTLPPPPPPPPPPQPGQAAPRVDVPLTATAEVTGCPRMFFPGFIGARKISLRDFANALTNFARRRVVDGTGLTGAYDIDLRFAVEGLPPGAPQPPADDNVPTLLTAVGEQLGLRLEPGRASVPVLVIDRVEPPTAN